MNPQRRRNFLKYLFAAFIFFSVVGVGQHAWAANTELPSGQELPNDISAFTISGYNSSSDTYQVTNGSNTWSNVPYTELQRLDGQKKIGGRGGLAQAAKFKQAQQNKTTREANDALGNCWVGFSGGLFDVHNCIVQILYNILWGLSFILGFAGIVFNTVFDYTVVNMKTNIGGIEVINGAWTVVRDLANIFFIFVLIYLAIVTILQLDEHGVRHSLSRLIIAAVLINFSLFFVKVIIDVPNILAINIHKAALAGVPDYHGLDKTDAPGLGDAFLYLFQPQKVFGTGDTIKRATDFLNQGGTATLGSLADTSTNFSRNPFSSFIMGIILMAVATFVFLAVIIIFLKRFVILIFLMAFSPLAFLGMALPIHAAESKAKQFWDTLFKEAFYAPIFMLCVLITLKVGFAINESSSMGEVGFWGNIMSYSVVIVMLVASLIIAEEMAVSGASGAMTAYNGMKGAALGAVGGGAQWVNARTVGRVASTLINKTPRGDKLRDMAAGKFGKNIFTRTATTAFGRAVVGAADKAGASFDEKVKHDQEWFQAAVSNRHGDHQFKAELYTQGASDGAYSADKKMLDNQWHEESLENKANMYMHWKDIANSKEGDTYLDSDHKEQKRTKKQIEGAKEAILRYIERDGHGRLEADEAAQLPRTIAEGLTYHDNKFRHAVEHARDHKDVSQMKKFLDTATEGQMQSAIKAVGATGIHFDTAMQKELSDGLMKFQGESMISSITKDNVLPSEIKEAASASMFKRKILWDAFTALKGNEGKAGSWDMADTLSSYANVLPDIKKEIDDYAASKSLVNMKALSQAFSDNYSKFQSSANYVINGNGRRTLIKSKETKDSLEQLYKTMDASHADIKAAVKQTDRG